MKLQNKEHPKPFANSNRTLIEYNSWKHPSEVLAIQKMKSNNGLLEAKQKLWDTYDASVVDKKAVSVESIFQDE
jgi:hypothetical protein